MTFGFGTVRRSEYSSAPRQALDGEACRGPFSFFRIFGLASYLSVEAASGHRASATCLGIHSYINPLNRDSGYIIRVSQARQERQRRRQPVQEMACPVQWCRQQIPAELPRLAKAAGDRRNPLRPNALLNATLNYDRASIEQILVMIVSALCLSSPGSKTA